MGKRKHSDREDYGYIMKKIKKLEKKLKRSKRKRSESTSSSNNSNYLYSSPKNVEDDGVRQLETRTPTPVAATSHAAATALPIITGPQLSTSGVEQEELPADNTLLELLGADLSVTKKFGAEINSDLAVRLQHIVTTGLTTDIRKELQNKYLPPSNCTLIGAPTLNPEIKAAISEAVLKRDKGIEVKQKQLGSAIACVSEAISVPLKDTEKNTDMIRILMDAIRLICDCQHSDSNIRRNFILFNLKKEMKDQLQKSKIYESLFGSDLADVLKTAKFISKSGAELKSAPAPPPKPPAPSFTKQKQKNLNWKPPPPSRRPRGTQETKEPAPRNQPTSFSRQSYRAPPRKNRNRQ